MTTPNATTLYGFGFHDLDTEPVVTITPAVPDRYFSVQAADHSSDGLLDWSYDIPGIIRTGEA